MYKEREPVWAPFFDSSRYLITREDNQPPTPLVQVVLLSQPESVLDTHIAHRKE